MGEQLARGRLCVLRGDEPSAARLNSKKSSISSDIVFVFPHIVEKIVYRLIARNIMSVTKTLLTTRTLASSAHALALLTEG